MEYLILAGVTLGLLWVLIGLPQQRRIKAHNQLVNSLEVGDEVVMTAGVFGRIVDLGPEEARIEVAPGVVLRVARHAVLRRVENALPDRDEGSAEGNRGENGTDHDAQSS